MFALATVRDTCNAATMTHDEVSEIAALLEEVIGEQMEIVLRDGTVWTGELDLCGGGCFIVVVDGRIAETDGIANVDHFTHIASGNSIVVGH